MLNRNSFIIVILGLGYCENNSLRLLSGLLILYNKNNKHNYMLFTSTTHHNRSDKTNAMTCLNAV